MLTEEIGMDDSFGIEGQVALVTGASRGIGLATAQLLAKSGATVFLGGRNQAALDEAIAALGSVGERVRPLPFDVCEEEQVVGATKHIMQQEGRLDILVNNAGMNLRRWIDESTIDDWHRVINANLTSTYLMSREAARIMAEQKGGRIIAIASAVSIRGRPAISAYTSAKHGVAGLVKSLGAELGPSGITVNGICPGYIRTEMTRSIQHKSDDSEFIVANTPAGRWGEPDDIAAAALFLASPAASFINGHLLVVDGGLTSSLLNSLSPIIE